MTLFLWFFKTFCKQFLPSCPLFGRFRPISSFSFVKNETFLSQIPLCIWINFNVVVKMRQVPKLYWICVMHHLLNPIFINYAFGIFFMIFECFEVSPYLHIQSPSEKLILISYLGNSSLYLKAMKYVFNVTWDECFPVEKSGKCVFGAPLMNKIWG